MSLLEASKNLKQKTMKAPVGEFISKLFHSRTMTHILHLNTDSYAKHKALNKYYDGIIDLTDKLAEEYQGKYGIIKGYTNDTINETVNPLVYIEQMKSFVETNRHSTFKDTDSNLQNTIDEIVSLLESTIYKLKFLK